MAEQAFASSRLRFNRLRSVLSLSDNRDHPRLPRNGSRRKRVGSSRPRAALYHLDVEGDAVGASSGLQCAVGHTIVEAPLVFSLALGLSTFVNPTSVRLIEFSGGSMLLIFAGVQFLQASRRIEIDPNKLPDAWQRRPGVLLGMAFTGLNPFFIVWWLTVGSTLISQAILLGAFGEVALMYAPHVWMDYAWLGGTAAVAGRGRPFLGKWSRTMLLIFGAAMAYFGVSFILAAL